MSLKNDCRTEKKIADYNFNQIICVSLWFQAPLVRTLSCHFLRVVL